ncbi:MAG: PspC domain-containing protein [Roseiflexaceae bacterium]
MSNIKRLERSRSDRMISGVCGGIARQFNLDTVIVRGLFVIVALIPGMLGVAAILYVVAIFLIPEEPETGAANTPHPGWRYDPWTGEPIANQTTPPATATNPPALESDTVVSDDTTDRTPSKPDM